MAGHACIDCQAPVTDGRSTRCQECYRRHRTEHERKSGDAAMRRVLLLLHIGIPPQEIADDMGIKTASLARKMARYGYHEAANAIRRSETIRIVHHLRRNA